MKHFYATDRIHIMQASVKEFNTEDIMQKTSSKLKKRRKRLVIVPDGVEPKKNKNNLNNNHNNDNNNNSMIENNEISEPIVSEPIVSEPIVSEPIVSEQIVSEPIVSEPIVSEPIVYELGIETAKLLKEKQHELQNITWSDGESNLDTEYSDLACDCCKEAWNIIKLKYFIYNNVDIDCIIPDIKITFTYSDGRTSKHKIELKSSKTKIAPGSTIKKLNINQTMIYCLRPHTNQNQYDVRCAQYYSAMGESETDLFQDRSPRPSINFDKMNDNALPYANKDKSDWVEHYANCGLKRISETTICQKSWQDDLVKKMKKKIIEDYVRNTSEHQFQIDKITLQVENTNI